MSPLGAFVTIAHSILELAGEGVFFIVRFLRGKLSVFLLPTEQSSGHTRQLFIIPYCVSFCFYYESLLHDRLICSSLVRSTTVMSTGVPSVLILGHSFVKRLELDLRSHFDHRAHSNLKLEGTVSVHLHGVGGRTAAKRVRSSRG